MCRFCIFVGFVSGNHFLNMYCVIPDCLRMKICGPRLHITFKIMWTTLIFSPKMSLYMCKRAYTTLVSFYVFFFCVRFPLQFTCINFCLFYHMLSSFPGKIAGTNNRDIFVCVQVILGKNGVEKVLDLGPLSDYEQEGLEKLKPELKASIEKGIKFANEN